MKVLVVGAGAVGTVYGRHLAQGGAEVSFYVREKYREEMMTQSKTGLRFYLWNETRNGQPKEVVWAGFRVLCSLEEVKATRWDAVVLSMSSTGLKGDWLAPFLSALPKDATLLTLQPGMHDRELLLKHFPAERLVEGYIPIVSYAPPLPGESLIRPSIAVWFPPFSKAPLTGPKKQAIALVRAFNQGGFPAVYTPPTRRANETPGHILSLFIAALKASQWSFDALERGPNLKLACQAMREVVSGPAAILLRPILFRIVIALSRVLVPFNFEAYLKVHFTKVSEQMRQSLIDLIERAERNGQLTPKLLELKGISD